MGDYHSDLRTGRLDALIGGGEQTISLLERTLDYDDDGVNVDVVLLGDPIPDGAIILAMWMFTPTPFKTNLNTRADFTLHGVASLDPYFTLPVKLYGAIGTSAYTIGEPIPFSLGSTGLSGDAEVLTFATTAPRIVVANYAAVAASTGDTVTALYLGIEAYASSGTGFTQGHADIYALIAEPAE